MKKKKPAKTFQWDKKQTTEYTINPRPWSSNKCVEHRDDARSYNGSVFPENDFREQNRQWQNHTIKQEYEDMADDLSD